jgi:hypothetical protein
MKLKEHEWQINRERVAHEADLRSAQEEFDRKIAERELDIKRREAAAAALEVEAKQHRAAALAIKAAMDRRVSIINEAANPKGGLHPAEMPYPGSIAAFGGR